MPLGSSAANHIILSFYFNQSEANSTLEQLTTDFHSSIRRIYSIKLGNRLSFTRGSRRLVAISSQNVPIEKSYKLEAWVNFEGKNVIWYPEKIQIYKPKKPFYGKFGELHIILKLMNSEIESVK